MDTTTYYKYINRTDIVFNGHLKMLVAEVKNAFDLKTNFQDDIFDISALNDIQRDIRMHFLKNQSRLTILNNKIIKNTPTSQPDIFAFFVALIIDDISDCYSFQDVFKKFKQQFIYNPENYAHVAAIESYELFQIYGTKYDFINDDDDTARIVFKCACGHLITQKVILQNSVTKDKILLGADCVCKTEITTKKELNKGSRLYKKRMEMVEKKIVRQKQVCRFFYAFVRRAVYFNNQAYKKRVVHEEGYIWLLK